MENPAAETVRTIESLDEEQYTNFVEERLERCTKPVTDKLSNNTLALFSRSQTKTQSKQQMQLTAVKSACSLFLRLYIECQSRNGDLQSKSTTLPDIRPNLMPQSLTEQPLSKCCSGKDLSRVREHSFCTLHIHSTGKKGSPTGPRLGCIFT